jgi:HSP20 family protein
MSINDDLWSPFVDLSVLQREMSRAFDNLETPSASRRTLACEFVPACDIEESASDYLITLDVPGFAKDDIEIEAKGNLLTISGNRPAEKREDGKTCHVLERARGKFQRTFTLPESSNLERIEAVCKDGVLKLSVPKTEAAKAHKIIVREDTRH